MEIINKKYYIGFEGEPEIWFIHEKEGVREILVLWEGYFEQIMSAIEPTEQGWEGMSYHYNMCSGWYEDDLWEIDDLQLTLEQFNSVNVDAHNLSRECAEILELLRSMLELAIANHHRVFIVRE